MNTDPSTTPERSDFIRDVVADDLRSGRTAVVTAVLDQSDPGSTAVRTVVSAAVA